MKLYKMSALRPGMVVGQDVTDPSGNIILNKFSKLSIDNISYLSFLGIPSVYIDDSFSEATAMDEILTPEIRQCAVRTVRDFFRKAEGLPIPETEERLERTVSLVVEEVLNNKDVAHNLAEVRTYDEYTYTHSVNVGVLAGVIGGKCGVGIDMMRELVMAGFLHDVGKVFVDLGIIHAPRRLTEEERVQMMAHPRLGYEYLTQNYNFSETVNRAVFEHHEWYNGYGYPNSKAGENLLPHSRILKAADVYDAMTSTRPYHPAYLPSEVLEYIMGRSGMEFDPRIVDAMAKTFCVYPVGAEIELSDGRHGIVIENHAGYVMRPTVKTLSNGTVIDLKADRTARSLTIVKLMM